MNFLQFDHLDALAWWWTFGDGGGDGIVLLLWLEFFLKIKKTINFPCVKLRGKDNICGVKTERST